MTEDISSLVERLRDRSVCSIAQNSCRNDYRMEQAADTIERLQAELATVRERTIEEAARVAESHFDDRPRMGRDFRWTDGYSDACRGAATAIRSLGDTPE